MGCVALRGAVRFCPSRGPTLTIMPNALRVGAPCGAGSAPRLRESTPRCRAAAWEHTNMSTLDEQVAIITGAVGNLGFATARAMQRAGARMVLVDRDQARVEAKYADLAGSADHLLAGGVDLASSDACAALAGRAVERFGHIDILVNTVGAFRGGKPVHEDDPGNWKLLFDVNVATAVNTCRAVVPTMLRQRRGRIINIASRAALAGVGGLSAYCASKAAVVRLTESLSAELKLSGINVNCVLPNTIDTPENRRALPDADPATWVAPEALADVIVFLASDAARAIHGAAIPVYGTG